jgi:hypothetical protein
LPTSKRQLGPQIDLVRRRASAGFANEGEANHLCRKAVDVSNGFGGDTRPHPGGETDAAQAQGVLDRLVVQGAAMTANASRDCF